MFYKNILFLIICVFLSNCTTSTLINNKPNKTLVNGYTNKGFALVYNDDLYSQKIIDKRIDERSLIIFQKNLKAKTSVKITNILNNKSLIAIVGKNSKYPSFNNSVISLRIAEELELDLDQPYVEVLEILENSIFVAQKAKTFEEEKSVAIKAPVNNVNISDLNVAQISKKKDFSIKFSYTIKIADFYFNKTALSMIDKIKKETLIKNPKIEKITDKQYRVYLGPFDNINSLQKSYNDIKILLFDNLEIIKND
jgi:hypothetical protein